jgi:hypothetical protein
MSFNLRLSILVSWIACVVLTVDGRAEASAPALSRVVIRVITLAGFIDELSVPSGRGVLEFSATPTGFSPDIETVAKLGLVSFYKTPVKADNAPTLGPVGPTGPTVVGQFKIDPTVNRYLVLIARSGTGINTSYSINAVPDAHGTFPNEHVRVMNFSSTQVALQMGEQRVTISSGADSVLPYPAGDTDHISWSLAKADPTGWKLMSRTEMTFPPERRVFIIISPGAILAGDAAAGISYSAGSELETKLIYDRDTSLAEAKGNKGAE